MSKVLIALCCLSLPFGLASAQTLVYGQSGMPSTLDTGQDTNSNTPAYQILDNLVFYDPEANELVPSLATSWSANEDSTVWTFELREGVTFHDGTPFDAEAVAFNFERWNDPDHEHRAEGNEFVPWTWSFGGFAGSEEALLEDVRVVDEFTIELTLARPLSLLPAVLASSYLGIHSPEAIMDGGDDYGTPLYGVVGTGPFVFDEWVEGERVVLTRYDDYWNEPALVEELVFVGFEDSTTRLAQIQAGAVDIAIELSIDDVERIEEDPALEVAATPNLNTGWIGFQQEIEPFGDPRVRQAVSYAVDREAIVDAFYGDLGTEATQLVPESLWGRADLETTYDYDPERARELLAEAGYPDGFATELWYMPVSRPYFPRAEPLAATVATYLAEVGIDAELMTVDWTTYLNEIGDGNLPMYMDGWIAEFPDPDTFLHSRLGTTALTSLGWTDEDHAHALDLMERARSVTDQQQRQDLYEEVVRLANDLAVVLPISHNSVVAATTTAVEGYAPPPLGTDVLWTVEKTEP